ncbi:MAG: hypothetical protein WBC91_26855 [Phototrophicaceae bacterium]
MTKISYQIKGIILVILLTLPLYNTFAQDNTIPDCGITTDISLFESNSYQEDILAIACDIDQFWSDFWRTDINNSYESPNYLIETRLRGNEREFAEELQYPPCGEGYYAGRYCPYDKGILLDPPFAYHIPQQYLSIIDILAHEWAHHVQYEVLFGQRNKDDVFEELEAECLKGAYYRYAIDNPNLTTVDITASDLINHMLLYQTDYSMLTNDTLHTNHAWFNISYGKRLQVIMFGYENGVYACNAIQSFNDFQYKEHIFAEADASYSLTDSYGFDYPSHWGVEPRTTNSINLSSRMIGQEAIQYSDIQIIVVWGDSSTILAEHNINNVNSPINIRGIGSTYRDTLDLTTSERIVLVPTSRFNDRDYYRLSYQQSGLDYAFAVSELGCSRYVSVLALGSSGNMDSYQIMIHSIIQSAQQYYYDTIRGLCAQHPTNLTDLMSEFVSDAPQERLRYTQTLQFRVIVIVLALLIFKIVNKEITRNNT